MWLKLRINLNLGLLKADLLQKLLQAVTETDVFDWVCMFSPTVVSSVRRLYPYCAD